MANRVVISICGEEYTLVADETPSYMQKVGSYVSDKMTDVMNAAKVGRTDAAVLTAVNLTDELFKSQTAAEQLRGQIKGYLDEASKALADFNAVAPIDGTVTSCNLTPGQEVKSGDTVVMISNNVTMLVTITVDDRNISFIKPGNYVALDWNGHVY